MWRAANGLFLAVARVAVYAVAIAGVIVAAALAPVSIAAAWAQLPSVKDCSGRMSACYQAWKMPDAMKRTRLAALANFAASAKAIAFQVVLGNDEYGLLYIDRGTSQFKLIYEKDRAYVRPHFSIDGKHLLLIQRHVGDAARKEIISCSTDTWRCAVLLQTKASLESPIEIEAGTLIYAASSRTISVKGSYRDIDWDFYLLKKGATPARLSHLHLSAIWAINAANDKLIFSGFGEALSRQKALARPSSKIYAVDLDRQSKSTRKLRTIETRHGPAFVEQIAPVFMIDDSLSHRASVSGDGRYAAVINNIKHGKYRWDTVLATSDGTAQRRIELNGLGFSRGEFVGGTLLFSELYEDWYYVHLLNIGNDKLETILHVDHAPEKLRALERIRLVVEGDP